MLDKKNKNKYFGAVYMRDKLVADDLIDVVVTVRRLSTGAALVTNQPATHVGGGLYTYLLLASHTENEDVYVAFFHTDDTSVNLQDMVADWTVGAAGVDFLDMPISNVAANAGVAAWEEFLAGEYAPGTAGWYLSNIISPQIHVVGPIDERGVLYLFKGDAYITDEGTSILFTDVNQTWPELDDGEVHFLTFGLDVVTEIVNPTGSNKQVRLELTAEQTAAFTSANVDYAIRYVRTNGNPTTLKRGGFVPQVTHH